MDTDMTRLHACFSVFLVELLICLDNKKMRDIAHVAHLYFVLIAQDILCPCESFCIYNAISLEV